MKFTSFRHDLNKLYTKELAIFQNDSLVRDPASDRLNNGLKSRTSTTIIFFVDRCNFYSNSTSINYLIAVAEVCAV